MSKEKNLYKCDTCEVVGYYNSEMRSKIVASVVVVHDHAR